MIALEVFGESASLERVARTLDETDGVSHVTCVEATRPGQSLVSARVRPRSVDVLLDALHGLGIADTAIALSRIDVIGALTQGRRDQTMVWADVMGAAWVNARPLARYLTFMLVAGVIACYGVVDDNGILIVGAMAVSPTCCRSLRLPWASSAARRSSPAGLCSHSGWEWQRRAWPRQLQRSARISWESSPPATASMQPGC